MILHSAAAEEAKTSNAADDSPPAAPSAYPKAVAAVVLRGEAPRDIGDYELEHILRQVG